MKEQPLSNREFIKNPLFRLFQIQASHTMCILISLHFYICPLSLFINIYLLRSLTNTHTTCSSSSPFQTHTHTHTHTHFQLSTGIILYTHTQLPLITHKHTQTQSISLSLSLSLSLNPHTYTNTLISLPSSVTHLRTNTLPHQSHTYTHSLTMCIFFNTLSSPTHLSPDMHNTF